MTKQAITSLIESLDSVHRSKGIELIIVDNGSTDETPKGIEEIKEEYENNNLIKIENVRIEKNMGYTPGINAGLSKCQGKIIAVLNNDLVFPPNWLNGLVEALESDEKIGLVAPYLSLSSGIQNVNKTFTSFDEMKIFAAHFMDQETNITFTHRVIGACMVFKQEVIELTGGNDIWFGLGQFDDDDWCIRTLLAGYKIAVVGKSFVHHICTVTYRQQYGIMQESYYVNEAKMRNKWGLQPIQTILDYVPYSKEKHYFPSKIEEFNQLPSPSIHKSKGCRQFLLVADWTHGFSKWKDKLFHSLQNLSGEDEIHLWIPNLYYRGFDALKEIKDLDAISLSKVKINHDTISPSDTLIFLKSFDAIYSVDEDYINKYFVSIAERLSIPAY